jgi:hypothetical protein
MRRHQYIPIWQVKAYLPGWSGVNSMGTVWPVGSLALSRKSLETAISEQGDQGRPLQQKAEHDEDEAVVLGMSDIGIGAGGGESMLALRSLKWRDPAVTLAVGKPPDNSWHKVCPLAG